LPWYGVLPRLATVEQPFETSASTALQKIYMFMFVEDCLAEITFNKGVSLFDG
jgi:hypothetical protein